MKGFYKTEVANGLKTTKLAPTQQYDISVGDIVVLNIGMATLQANPILPDIANFVAVSRTSGTKVSNWIGDNPRCC